MGTCGFTKDYCDLTISYYYACDQEITKDGTFPTCKSLANSDVTGLATLTAFFATASLTFILAWTMMVFGVDCAGDTKASQRSQSLVDQRFWKTVWYCAGHQSPRNLPPQIELFCHKLMLTFSDIHLATGAAILVAGYSQVCNLTIYHYHAVVYLAWTSSTVHLLTLLICRKHLQRRKYVLRWRLLVMSVNLVLLVVAIALTGSKMWPSNVQGSGFSLDAPISCTWHYGNMKLVTFNAAVPMILVIGGFIARLAKISPHRSTILRHYFRDLPADKLKSCFDRCSQKGYACEQSWLTCLLWDTVLYLIIASYLQCRAAADLYESILLEMIWTTLMLLYGAGELFGWRSWSPLRQYENQWRFGQILLLTLVLSPLLAIPEMLHSSKEEEKSSMMLEQLQESSGYELPLLQQIHEQTSTQIEDVHSKAEPPLIPILTTPEVAFASIGFNLTIASIIVTIMAVFGLMLWARFTGSTFTVGDLSGPMLYDMLPLYVAVISSPHVIWWMLCAPFSRIIVKALKTNAENAAKSRVRVVNRPRQICQILCRFILGGWSLIPMLVVLKKYGAFEDGLYISPDR